MSRVTETDLTPHREWNPLISQIATGDPVALSELHAQAESLIIDLSSIYEYLETKGGAKEREYIVFADTPIQFLMPEANSLTNEALTDAVEKDVDGLTARGRGQPVQRVVLETADQGVTLAELSSQRAVAEDAGVIRASPSDLVRHAIDP